MAEAKAKKAVYDESKVQTLSPLEHIRLRTGMYIGRIGDGTHYDDGCYILLKEVVDNSIDEYIMGHGRQIEITVEDEVVMVRDFGRGIPLGKVIDCVSQINTGAKYNDEVFQFSVGLNGVGTKAVNALSSEFIVRSYRDGKYKEATFERGELLEEVDGDDPHEPDGTFVCFSPDPKIFKKYAFREEHLEKRMRHYAYLNSGLTILFNGKKFHSKKGLLDLIAEELDGDQLYEPIYFSDRTLEFALTHSRSRYGENFQSFVNGQFTSDGGTHLSAFREGILKGVNEYAKGKYDGDDVRESMVGAIAIRLQDPMFESQTKNKLGNTEIRTELVNRVREIILQHLHTNRDVAEKLIQKVEDTQQLRKELQQVKKMARERSKAVAIRVPQLRDSKNHLDLKKNRGWDTMIFLTEGASAAGPIASNRDPNCQAIFTLKGKPLNVWDLKRDALYKNDEMFNLMKALGIEDSIDGLRYSRIILATDADVDGMHIRNLLITFFFKFFEELIQRGHLFILETPLFRVRNKKENIYCYSEKEKDEAIKKLGRGHEITRFKGLGEISPTEFGAFIGRDMRLSQIEFARRTDTREILDFYMGKNTPVRKSFIMDNLVVPVED
jgi:DNA gyrase subunit B/topoisomerase-4 subunit B